MSMDQGQLAELITAASKEFFQFLAYGVVAFILGLTVQRVAITIFTWFNILVSRDKGTREGDLVELSGQIYKINRISLTRIHFVSIDIEDDTRSMNLAKYWTNQEIHAISCVSAYRETRTIKNRRDTDGK